MIIDEYLLFIKATHVNPHSFKPITILECIYDELIMIHINMGGGPCYNNPVPKFYK